MITASVKQSVQQITQGVLTEVAEHINDVLQRAGMAIRNKVEAAIEDAIMASPEVDSLLYGDLRKQLGIEDARPIVESIVNTIKQNMEFAVDRTTVLSDRLYGGGYTIKVLRGDFTDVLSLPDTSYVTKKNVLIPWLNWLLFAGDSPVLYGWKIVLDPNNPQSSRTGAVMVKSDSGAWGVPQEYAGTAENNFLTRALSGLQDNIEKIINQELEQRM